MTKTFSEQLRTVLNDLQVLSYDVAIRDFKAAPDAPDFETPELKELVQAQVHLENAIALVVADEGGTYPPDASADGVYDYSGQQDSSEEAPIALDDAEPFALPTKEQAERWAAKNGITIERHPDFVVVETASTFGSLTCDVCDRPESLMWYHAPWDVVRACRACAERDAMRLLTAEELIAHDATLAPVDPAMLVAVNAALASAPDTRDWPISRDCIPGFNALLTGPKHYSNGAPAVEGEPLVVAPKSIAEAYEQGATVVLDELDLADPKDVK